MSRPAAPWIPAVLWLLAPACGGGGGDPCAEDTRCLSEHRRCLVVDGHAVCGDCLSGFHEEAQACVADQACGPNTCSGHGQCDDSGGSPSCACDAGYAGETCATCAPGYHAEAGACVPDAPASPCPPETPGYVGEAAWPRELVVTAGATYCWPFWEGLSLETSLPMKAQLHLVAGSYRLPTSGPVPLRLPACALLSPAGPALLPADAGEAQGALVQGNYQLQYAQPLQAALPWQLELWHSTNQPGPLVLDGGHIDDSESYTWMNLCQHDCAQGGEQRQFDSCTFAGYPRTLHRVEFQGGRIELELRLGWSMASTEPGIFFRAAGELDGVAFDQLDYWKLVYRPEHHHFSRDFAVLFDAPIGGACALRVTGVVPWEGNHLPVVETADCQLAPLAQRTVASLETEVIQP